jgi:hypothetical protein
LGAVCAEARAAKAPTAMVLRMKDMIIVLRLYNYYKRMWVSILFDGGVY